MKKVVPFLFVTAAGLLSLQCSPEFEQAQVEARKVEIISDGDYTFKDLNKNGTLDPYEDWRLPVEERIENLVELMTLEEKVGLMFHPNISVPEDGQVKYDFTEEEKAAMEAARNEQYGGPIGPGGQQAAGGGMAQGQMRGSATAKSYIEEKNFRSILNNGVAPPKEFATWSNSMQEIAEGSRLGIPIMFSTDPRHGATLGAHVSGVQHFSQWPSKEGQVGITASRNSDILKKFGEVVAEEYRAVGLHMILGPQIDLMTEPRWNRNMGAFSEDANLTADMLAAFMDGAQGENIGSDKILVHLKHWPGAGSHEGGSGLWLVYPGNNFDYHLIPWKKGIEKGALAVMGYYSGTYFDSLNVCFSPYLSTEVLYNQLGFKGAICTDWGVVGGIGPLHPDLKGKTTMKENMGMIVNAGVDQMGSQTENQLAIELVHEGILSEERINTAAKRILQWHFMLGLFEDPYVDPEAASGILQSEKNQKLGYQAQLESIILLTNSGVLPAAESTKIYVEGIDKEIASTYAEVVDQAADADLIIVRASTDSDNPMADMMALAQGLPGFADIKDPGQLVGAVMRAIMQGVGPNGETVTLGDILGVKLDRNIAFPQGKWESIRNLAKTGVPVVVAFNPTGTSPVLPGDLKDVTSGSLMIFDALDNALLDVVFGKFNPVGKLPFEIPASMEAVYQQLEDVPYDSENPAFGFGHGLSY